MYWLLKWYKVKIKEYKGYDIINEEGMFKVKIKGGVFCPALNDGEEKGFNEGLNTVEACKEYIDVIT